jgi:hypothetical protein
MSLLCKVFISRWKLWWVFIFEAWNRVLKWRISYCFKFWWSLFVILVGGFSLVLWVRCEGVRYIFSLFGYCLVCLLLEILLVGICSWFCLFCVQLASLVGFCLYCFILVHLVRECGFSISCSITAFGIIFFFTKWLLLVLIPHLIVKLCYFIKFNDVVECSADTCLIVVDVFICLTSNCNLLTRWDERFIAYN